MNTITPVGPQIVAIEAPQPSRRSCSTGMCGNPPAARVTFINGYKRHYCEQHLHSLTTRYGLINKRKTLTP